jgi:hypothetical protein
VWAVTEELIGVTSEALTPIDISRRERNSPSSGTARTADRQIQDAGTLTTN